MHQGTLTTSLCWKCMKFFNHKRCTFLIRSCWLVLFATGFVTIANAQAEFTTWGNLTGIRVNGQLMAFETSVCIVTKDWLVMNQTAREKQPVRFSRQKNKQVFSYVMDSLNATNAIETIGPGVASIDVEYRSLADTSLAGVFFRIDLPAETYTGSTVQLVGGKMTRVIAKHEKGKNEYLKASAKGISINALRYRLAIVLSEESEIIVRDDRRFGDNDIQVYIKVMSGDMKRGQTVKKNILIKAAGEVDKSSIRLTLDTSKPGRPFEGLGGNFRLQNEKTDPPVIDYCLQNLRVAHARVEMPWRFWQPEEDSDPAAIARSGKLHTRVRQAMEIAQRLYRMGMPVILSNWSAPDWAIQGTYSPQPVNGAWGNPLDDRKKEKIYGSIAAYLLYLKENYGVEVEAFSFNESDLGINIRQTPEEHRQMIKGLGAYLAAKGLKTKLLLGDTADVTGWAFTHNAAADTGTHPYISAVSFHSWRGCSDENLAKWDSIARRINKPLLVGEGSIDAGAWRYPKIFEEPTYAAEEINLYVKILAICQPLSILQWQLTADYSPLSGGGVFGNNEKPLYPTQRFWNLKQLASTPLAVVAMPVISSAPDVTCAALGNNTRETYAIHLVNNGATREVMLNGLPNTVKKLRMYTTNSSRGMEEGKPLIVTQGRATFTADANSFISLMTAP